MSSKEVSRVGDDDRDLLSSSPLQSVHFVSLIRSHNPREWGPGVVSGEALKRAR